MLTEARLVSLLGMRSSAPRESTVWLLLVTPVFSGLWGT
jgi:hypothetical protein